MSYILAVSLFILYIAFQQIVDMHKAKTRKVRSQKKSSEVRLGQISEQLAPFLDGFDYNPKEIQFMGQPIDYISFGEDEITIIEVKSGKSRLNKKQRRIRDQIKDGKVRWEVFRIDGN